MLASSESNFFTGLCGEYSSIKLNKSLFDFWAGGDSDCGWIGIPGAGRDCKIIENPSLCKQRIVYLLYILYEIPKIVQFVLCVGKWFWTHNFTQLFHTYLI